MTLPTKILLALFVVFSFSPQLSNAATSTTQTASGRALEISGWIPYWRTATGTADALAHIDSFTEINPFGYTVKNDGTVVDTAKLGEEPWTTLFAAARTKKVKIIPTVMWSNTSAMHSILSKSKTRIALEDAIVKVVKDNNFDGIDIDFEGKDADDKDYFSTFLKGLYTRLGKKSLMCTIEARTPVEDRYDSTPPKDAYRYANDYVAINKYCDRVRLMTYDQWTVDLKLTEAHPDPYIPVSDPVWVERVIDLAAKTISKKKLVIGIPTYGYEFKVTKLKEQGYRYDFQWAFNPRYALELAPQFGLSPTRNPAGELSFMYVPTTTPKSTADTTTNTQEAVQAITFGVTSASGTPSSITTTQPFHIVWWSDAQAIEDKVKLAQRLGVKGIAIFKIDGGEDPAMWSVLPKRVVR